MVGMRLCEEQARIERPGCGEEAESTNVLHNDELKSRSSKVLLLRATVLHDILLFYKSLAMV
jgi:hypothetical protein